MGGSGGGYSISRAELDSLREQAEQRTQRSMRDAEINALLGRELVRMNDRDTATVGRYLDQIADVLGEDVEAFDRLSFGGSVAKHTYVDGLSDIDSLAVLDGAALGDLSPEQLREHFARALRSRLASGDVADVTVGRLAVTVHYRDGTEIQLLPAVRRGDRVDISSQDGTRWKTISPRSFARELARVNQEQHGALVPAVKLAKSVIAGLPDSARLSGYHVEALALAAFKDYDGSRTPKEMVTRFFEKAASAVLRPAPDSTGQSRHIDESLGEANSAARQAASRELGRIRTRMQQSTSVDDWREILGV